LYLSRKFTLPSTFRDYVIRLTNEKQESTLTALL